MGWPARLAIITGDPRLPDPAKVGGRRSSADEAAHRAMAAAFAGLGRFHVTILDDHRRLLDDLGRLRPDLAVNFCDTGFCNQARLEPAVPALLDALAIPYTGSHAQAMILATDKAATRLLADNLGISVPAEAFVARDGPPDALPDMSPAIVKPNCADGSLGIFKDAVVNGRRDALDYIERLRALLPGHDLLVQEYLPGPELSLATLGNPGTDFRVLPVAQWDLSGYPAGVPPILCYEAKAVPDSPLWEASRLKPAELLPGEAAMLSDWAERLIRRIGIRDYARLDLRRGADGRLRFIEINPNPAWGEKSMLAYMAGLAGLDYAQLLAALIETAATRLRPP